MVDGMLYINTLESSVKVRNIRQNPRVAVSIPARKLPFFPPFRVQF
ncbi:MAG: pyridoxamine 5'-phosphate oxidase family protein [Thermomicrobiales bacterium]